MHRVLFVLLCLLLGRRSLADSNDVFAQNKDSLADRLWFDLNFEKFSSAFSDLKFCFDFDGDRELLNLMRNTFPLLSQQEQETSIQKDEICNNFEISKYICQKSQDFTLYFKFVMLTDNPEQIPDTEQCRTSDLSQTSGCLPGFFQSDRGPKPCCPGFFCPLMMNCMVPCPIGANCPQAKGVTVPDEMLRGLKSNIEQRICSPYGYEERPDLGCGGADKWDVAPPGAYFHVEDNRDHIYCPVGHYCANTTGVPERCEEGYFCRVGSVKPKGCPFLTFCKAGTSSPEDYYGWLFDGIVFFLLIVIWQASKFYNKILRRLTDRERIRIRWGVQPQWDIVPTSTHSPNNSTRGVASPFANGPGGPSGLSPSRPRLVALPTLSSSLSINLDRKPKPSSSFSLPPAVWASLSEEHKPKGEKWKLRKRLLLTENGDDSSSTESNHPQEEVQALEETHVDGVNIEIYNLDVKLKSCGKYVVSGASANFRSSKLTVLMGPSGCGKTSLLSFLANESDYMMVRGSILINGEPTTLKKFRKVTGFVPQDDIVHPRLTVEENLLFSARFRLPKHTSRREHLELVDRAISLLGLTEVRNSLVGNEESRGVSGGQRKRVNIGLELVADPCVMFLDEPTSGLDSSSCRHVITVLSRVAHMGVTCAAVVHQPSNRIMSKFDDILLLGSKGGTVYYGPQSMLNQYFLSLGYHFPMNENPADVYLDIITRPKSAPCDPTKTLEELYEASEISATYLRRPDLNAPWSPESLQHTSTEILLDGFGFIDRVKNTIWTCLFLLWSPFGSIIDFCKTFFTSARQSRSLRMYYAPLDPNYEDEELRETPGFLTQFWICFYRCILERTRTALRIFLEYALFALCGMLLGMLSESRSNSRLRYFVGDMNFSLIAIALMTTVSSLRTFTQNQLIFFREARSGLNKLSYCCAVTFFGDIGSILKGLCYLSLYYSYAQPRSRFSDMFLVTSATIYSCSGIGYFISKMMRPGPSQLSAAMCVLINALLATTSRSIWIQSFRWILYHRWALEAYTLSEAKELFGVWSLERCGLLQAMGYDIRNFGFSIFALFLLGAFARLFTFGVIVYGARNRSES